MNYPNLTCIDETNPCTNADQIIDAAMLELTSLSSMLYNFSMIIKISHLATLGHKPFDFSKYVVNFNLFLIGNPNFYFPNLVGESELWSVNELYIDGAIKPDRLLSTIAGVNSLKIANSHLSSIDIVRVVYIEIVNSSLPYLSIQGNPKKLDISDSFLPFVWISMHNFQVFSIRNSIWRGGLSEFVSGEIVNIYNTTTSPIIFISISQVKFEEINVINGNFDFLYHIAYVKQVYIIGSNFFNNTISPTKSLMVLEHVKYLNMKTCDYSFNRGGFLLIDNNSFYNIDVQLSESSFNNNQLQGVALLKINGAIYIGAYYLIFINNSNENSTSCFDITGGNVYIKESTFKNNTGIKGGAAHLSMLLTGKIHETIFSNNLALDSGGALYLENKETAIPIIIDKMKCEDNYANRYGGCLYSNFPVKNITSGFNNNIAGYYGNNIAFPLQDIIVKDNHGNLLENDILQLIPGTFVSFRLYVSDRLNQSTNFLPNDNLQITHTNTSNETTSTFINFQKGEGFIMAILQIIPKIEELKQVEFFLNVKSPQLTKIIRVELLPCPNSYLLKESIIGYSCVYYPLEIIITTTIIATILSISLIVFSTCGIVYIIRRLLKLRKQEQAEKEMERKFNGKDFIFGLEEMTESLLSNNANNNTELNQHIIPIHEIDIIKKIGEGGMGVVFLGKWNRTDVAIKKLKTQTDDNEFEKEAVLMSSLRHPSIVSCYGVCIATDDKYLIVEYMEKGSLENALFESKQGRNILRLERKLKILLDIAKGMAYLHSTKPHKIVHRDLKSANILLDVNYNAKVGDFGLSKFVSELSAMTCNIGSFFYCAPVSLLIILLIIDWNFVIINRKCYPINNLKVNRLK